MHRCLIQREIAELLYVVPHVVPSHTPVTREDLEIVLFVGPPASGKTSLFRKNFSPKYKHINQDTLKTRDKCLRVAEDYLQSGTSVVIGKRVSKVDWR
jgi:bifunctional polynucleotide phosphatase/kinase